MTIERALELLLFPKSKTVVTQTEIKTMYRKLAKKYHPDNKETGNNGRYIKVQEAYEYLKVQNKSAFTRRSKVKQPTRQTKSKEAGSVFTHSETFGNVKITIFGDVDVTIDDYCY